MISCYRLLERKRELQTEDFAAWTMHFQIMMKERPMKCIFKVNLIFRISILLLHVSALQERHLQRAQRIPENGAPAAPKHVGARYGLV
jgi:hypothetical protein